MKQVRSWDYLHLHFIVILWGFTAIIGVKIELPTLQLVVMRTLLTVLGLGLYLRWRKIPLRMEPSLAWPLLLNGFLIGLHWLSFFGAARVANVSTCLAGLSTTSFWTSLIEPWLLGRRFRWYEAAMGLLVMAGLSIVVTAEWDKVGGLAIGLASAIFAAFFSVFNARFIQRHSATVITLYEMIGAAGLMSLAWLVVGLSPVGGENKPLVPSGADWGYLLVLSFVCTVYAYAAAVDLLKRFTPFAMNLTINLEPVYGIVLAWLLLGDAEKMTPAFYAGTALILASVLTYPLLHRLVEKRRPEAETISTHV